MQPTNSQVVLDIMISRYLKRQQVSVGLHESLASQQQLILLQLSKVGTVAEHGMLTCTLVRYSDSSACFQALDLAKSPNDLGLTVAGNPWKIDVMFSEDPRSFGTSHFVCLNTDSKLVHCFRSNVNEAEYVEGGEEDWTEVKSSDDHSTFDDYHFVGDNTEFVDRPPIDEIQIREYSDGTEEDWTEVVLLHDPTSLDDSQFPEHFNIEPGLSQIVETRIREYSEGTEDWPEGRTNQWVVVPRHTPDQETESQPEDMRARERALLAERIDDEPGCKRLEQSSGYGTGDQSTET